MKNHFYIIMGLLLIIVTLGCQTGKKSYPTDLITSGANLKFTGVVTTDGTSPVESAKVTLYPSGKSAFTDSSGYYFIFSDASSTSIKVEKTGYNTEVSAISQGSSVVNIQLTEGASTFTGTVMEKNTDILISNATAEITSKMSELNTYTARTGLNGKFQFSAIPAEDYDLTISHPDYQIIRTTLSTDQLAEAKDTFELVLTSPDEYDINGSVFQEASNSAISDATVEILTQNNEPYQDQVTKTDSSGEYIFQSIPSGYYKLRISKSNYLTYYKIIDVNSSITVSDIHLNLTEGSQPTGEGTKEIEFLIDDAETSLPIEGAIISFKDTIYNRITDENGKCSFEVPVTQYNVEVKKDGYLTQTRSINIADDYVNPVNIPMIYDLVDNLGAIKGKISRCDEKEFTTEVVVTATLNTSDELGQDIVISTTTDNFKYSFKNLQILYDGDGKEYKYRMKAWYDIDRDNNEDTSEISLQIVDLEAGKNSIADMMIIAPIAED